MLSTFTTTLGPSNPFPGFKTNIGTPNHPSYTSGHAAFSAAAAEVLAYFFPSDASQFQKLAEEAAISRIYGGIHYSFDADAGLSQGKAAAAFDITKARQDGAD